MSHCILVHGHNGGYRQIHAAGPIPNNTPIQDFNAKTGAALGSVGYSVELVPEGAWVSIFQIRKDLENDLSEGVIAFSIYVPQNNRVDRMREALDRVLTTYDQMTGRTGNVEILSNWGFIDKLSEVLPYTDEIHRLTPLDTNRQPVAKMYVPNSDIKELLQEVFQPAYSRYQRVFIVPEEVKGTERDPLTSILGEQLNSTPDISGQADARSYRIEWKNTPSYPIANRSDIPASIAAGEVVGMSITIERPYHQPVTVTVEANDVNEDERIITLEYPSSDAFAANEKTVNISVAGVSRYNGRVRAKENKELAVTEDELSIITFEGDEIGLTYILTITSDKYPEYTVEFTPENTSQLNIRLDSGTAAASNASHDFIEINFTLGRRSHVSPGHAEFTCENDDIQYNNLNHSIAFPKGMKLNGIRFSLTFEKNYRTYQGTLNGQSTLEIPLKYRAGSIVTRYLSLAIIIVIIAAIGVGVYFWKNSGHKKVSDNPDANTPMVTAVSGANGQEDLLNEHQETNDVSVASKENNNAAQDNMQNALVNESDCRFIKAIPDFGSLKCIVTRIEKKQDPCSAEQEKLLTELYELVLKNKNGNYSTWYSSNKDCPNLEVFVQKYKSDNQIK